MNSVVLPDTDPFNQRGILFIRMIDRMILFGSDDTGVDSQHVDLQHVDLQQVPPYSHIQGCLFGRERDRHLLIER